MKLVSFMLIQYKYIKNSKKQHNTTICIEINRNLWVTHTVGDIYDDKSGIVKFYDISCRGTRNHTQSHAYQGYMDFKSLEGKSSRERWHKIILFMIFYNALVLNENAVHSKNKFC